MLTTKNLQQGVESSIFIIILQKKQQRKQNKKLEFGMYPQSMPTEWTHARTVRPWQSVRLDFMTRGTHDFVGQSSLNLAHVQSNHVRLTSSF